MRMLKQSATHFKSGCMCEQYTQFADVLTGVCMRSWQWQLYLLMITLLANIEHGSNEDTSTFRWSFVRVAA